MSKPIIKTPAAKDLPSSHLAAGCTISIALLLIVVALVIVIL